MQFHRPTRRDQSGFSAIEALLVILVVAALAVTGLVVYQHHKLGSTKNSAATNQTHMTTTQSTNTTTTQAQQTTTLATYKSPVGNFSFNYPNTWSVSGGPVPGENNGYYRNEYYINILPVSANASQQSDNDFTMQFFVNSNPDSMSPPARIPYGTTTQKFSNGVNVWTTSSANSKGARPSSDCPELLLINANATHLSYALSDGQYLALKGGYCENLKDAPTANYSQQLASQNWQAAIAIVQSIKFQ